MFGRWGGQAGEQDAGARLPGWTDGAVERHFDVPEAMDLTFYEVRAKSALNRVPRRSRVPFEWTVNPYRGCTHACTYCFARPGEYVDVTIDGATSQTLTGEQVSLLVPG